MKLLTKARNEEKRLRMEIEKFQNKLAALQAIFIAYDDNPKARINRNNEAS